MRQLLPLDPDHRQDTTARTQDPGERRDNAGEDHRLRTRYREQQGTGWFLVAKFSVFGLVVGAPGVL